MFEIFTVFFQVKTKWNQIQPGIYQVPDIVQGAFNILSHYPGKRNPNLQVRVRGLGRSRHTPKVTQQVGGWELGFESRSSELQAHAQLQSTEARPTQKSWHAAAWGQVSFLQHPTSHRSQGTKRKQEPRPQTDHRTRIPKITLGYLLSSTRKHICIYANTYIDVYTYTVYKHTNTHVHTHTCTHRVDTSPIWNSAIQRPHLSGTQPRNKEVSKKGIWAARLDVSKVHALKLMHLTRRRNLKAPTQSLFILILYMIRTTWVKWEDWHGAAIHRQAGNSKNDRQQLNSKRWRNNIKSRHINPGAI